MTFLVVFVAAFVAGAINSVAGGGTLLTFPALIWVGLPSTIANATSTVAIWPGSLGGVWGYRQDLPGLPKSSYLLMIPSLKIGRASCREKCRSWWTPRHRNIARTRCSLY